MVCITHEPDKKTYYCIVYSIIGNCDAKIVKIISYTPKVIYERSWYSTLDPNWQVASYKWPHWVAFPTSKTAFWA